MARSGLSTMPMYNKSILAFDCASSGANISLSVNGELQTRTVAQGRQAAELVAKINELMKQAALSYADLGLIITTIGPGSFTGLRIGLAALHGLVLVHHTPIKLLTTLDSFAWAVARQTHAPADFFVAIRAGKGEVYVQAFALTSTSSRPVPTSTTAIFLAPEHKTEWDRPFFSNHIPPDSPYYLPGVDTELLCTIAEDLPRAALSDALPLYIRPPDAIIPKTAAWLVGRP